MKRFLFCCCCDILSREQDSSGISNMFVLDLCDTANTQDPRNGRTSLMTAVLDNNEVWVYARAVLCPVHALYAV